MIASPALEASNLLTNAAWLLDDSGEAALITDTHGEIVYVNPAFESLTGYERGAALGRTPAILRSGRQEQSYYRNLWETLQRGNEFRGVLINRRRDGTLYHEEKTIRPLRDGAGQVRHYVSSGRDVSARIEAFERLAHEASHDALTGLPNRSLYLDRIEQARIRGARCGAPFAVAMIDVDRFKPINDRYGHEVGDAVLCAVARRLRASVREIDTAARIGGDEFALLLPDTDEPARVLASIVRACAEPIAVEGGLSIAVTLSVGVSVFSGDGSDAAALLRNADRAMYRVKQAGGGAVGFHAAACRLPVEAAQRASAIAAVRGPADRLLEHVPVRAHGPKIIDSDSPSDNRLLAALADADWQRWQPHLEHVDLKKGQVLFEPGRPIRHAYFPTSGMVSMVHILRDGSLTGVSVVGREGLLGVSLLLGSAATIQFCSVVIPGQAYRIAARVIKDEFDRSDSVRPLLLRYTLALITQIAQAAVCNRHHSVEQHLCGWLLHSLDRIGSSDVSVTQEHIANILGVRRESVTEAAVRLQAAGLIHSSRGRIAVLDRRGLEQRSCECHAQVKQAYQGLLPWDHAARAATPKLWTGPALNPDALASYGSPHRRVGVTHSTAT